MTRRIDWLRVAVEPGIRRRFRAIAQDAVNFRKTLRRRRGYTLLTPGAENPWVKLYENCL